MANVDINLKRVEIILEQISTIIKYPKFEWTAGYIIEMVYHILISVFQNDGIAPEVLDQNKETIKR